MSGPSVAGFPRQLVWVAIPFFLELLFVCQQIRFTKSVEFLCIGLCFRIRDVYFVVVSITWISNLLTFWIFWIPRCWLVGHAAPLPIRARSLSLSHLSPPTPIPLISSSVSCFSLCGWRCPGGEAIMGVVLWYFLSDFSYHESSFLLFLIRQLCSWLVLDSVI